MEIKLIFSIIWIVLLIIAFGHYYYSIFKWETKPHVYTWLLFSLLLTTTFFIQSSHGWWLGTYILLADSIACIITFIIALFYGSKNITLLDTLFLVWWIIAIIMWLIFDQPVISTILIILIDFIALLPTYRKCWSEPYEETVVIYFISGLIFLSSFIAIENYSFLTVWHQIAVITFDWGLALYIIIRRKLVNK